MIKGPSMTIQKPRLIMMMGRPASGKTTLAKKLATQLGAAYLSSHDARERFIEKLACNDFLDENLPEPGIRGDEPDLQRKSPKKGPDHSGRDLPRNEEAKSLIRSRQRENIRDPGPVLRL